MVDAVWFQAVQIAGALLVLGCFLAAQADRMDPATYRYLLPNLVGSSAMAATAVLAGEWGFVLLEGSWALVSAWATVQLLDGRRPGPVH